MRFFPTISRLCDCWLVLKILKKNDRLSTSRRQNHTKVLPIYGEPYTQRPYSRYNYGRQRLTEHKQSSANHLSLYSGEQKP